MPDQNEIVLSGLSAINVTCNLEGRGGVAVSNRKITERNKI